MPPIGADLRGEMRRLRRHPVKWGKPRGLTQQELADMAGISPIWVRQVETGAKGASPNTVGRLCYTLELPVKWLRDRRYYDIAYVVAELGNASVTSRDVKVNGFSHNETLPEPVTAAEQRYLRDAPTLTEDEQEQLIITLRVIRERKA